MKTNHPHKTANVLPRMLSGFLGIALFIGGFTPLTRVGPASAEVDIQQDERFTWYVAPPLGGDDANDCTSPSMPCATINAALNKDAFYPGDTVMVAKGTYTGSGNSVVLIESDVRLSGGWDLKFVTQIYKSRIDGENARRGIGIFSNYTVHIENFEIVNGFSTYDGGGIYNSGNLFIQDSIIKNNEGLSGGGIYNSKILNARNIIIDQNIADYLGGGLFNGDIGNVTIKNSAITRNYITGFGAGIYNKHLMYLNTVTISGNWTDYITGGAGGGINHYAGVLIGSNLTITENAAEHGGGISQYAGEISLQNSILAGNLMKWHGPDCAATITSLGYNLIGSLESCSYTPGPGDIIGENPLLFPLIPETGLQPITIGSPALDKGNPAGCTSHLGNPLETDQRGAHRYLDGNGDGAAYCDIGAYELIYGADSMGVFDPSIGNFKMRNTNDSGLPDFDFTFADDITGGIPLAGDWDGDGVDTIGVFDPVNGEFRLRNSNSGGAADIIITHPNLINAVPLTGDWDGDGIDTIGIYVKEKFLLRNSNDLGSADLKFNFGGSRDIPITGDWDGDGMDTIGFYTPGESSFSLRNSNSSGPAEVYFQFGWAGLGLTPIMGDWDGDGDDDVGIFLNLKGKNMYALRYSNSEGRIDLLFQFGVGNSSIVPIAGNWDG